MIREKRMIRNEEEEYLEGSDDDDVESHETRKTEELQDDDTLDAFMKELTETLTKEEEKKRLPIEQNYNEKLDEEEEEEDTVADMIEAIQKYHDTRKNDPDLLDEDDERPRDRVVLPPVDHSTVRYNPFPKNTYKEHQLISNMPMSERLEKRAAKKIIVTGYKVPQPVESFYQLKQTILKGLFTNILEQGWQIPTPVQAQLIPVVLYGQDAIAVAQTGSGKTGAYSVSLIQHVSNVLDEWRMISVPNHRGPIGLVLSPTRELAAQIYGVLKQLSKNLQLRVSCFSGGYEKKNQFKEIVEGIEICVANPGRLIDLCTMKGGAQLKDVTICVLDEVDRMLDMGFYPEVSSICESLRPDRLLVVVSATLPSSTESLVNSLTKSCVKIVIGTEGQASETIEQRPVVFADEQRKVDWIVNNIHKLIRWDRQILIFCKSHGRTLDLSAVLNSVILEKYQLGELDNREDNDVADETIDDDNNENMQHHIIAPAAVRLAQTLSDETSDRQDIFQEPGITKNEAGVISALPTLSINSKNVTTETRIFSRHLFGTMNQGERQSVLRSFRKKNFPILVASDVAARGLDIPNVSTVISYDAAQQFETHTHRIGRTGRAGQKGIAYTLLTRRDAKLAGFIVEEMQRANCIVPKQVLQLAMTFEVFRRAQQSNMSFTDLVKSRKTKDGRKNKKNAGNSGGLGYFEERNKPKNERKSGPPSWEAPGSSFSRPQKKSRFSSIHPGEKSQTAYNKTGANLEEKQKKPLKVFNPTDTISSSSSEDENSKQLDTSPCLLKPKMLASKEQVLLDQQKILSRVLQNMPRKTLKKSRWD